MVENFFFLVVKFVTYLFCYIFYLLEYNFIILFY
jgi:hypothetical protein